MVEDDLPSGERLVDLGESRLKDVPRPEHVFQLVAEGLPAEFPPLKTVEEQELAEAAQAVLEPSWLRQRRRLLVPLAGVAALAVIVGVLALLRGGSDGGPTSVSANALGLIDADDTAIDAEIPTDASPTNVALGEDALWVTNSTEGTVSRIDLLTRSVRQTIPVGTSPSGIAVVAGAVWVANHDDGTVSRIDPQTNNVVDTVRVGNGATAVAFGEGSIWVTNSFDRSVSRIDPESGRVAKTFTTDAVGRGIAVGGGSVWVTDESSRSVMRVDPEANRIAETISVGNGPTGIAFGEKGVWVANSIDETVSRIDPETAVVTATLPVAGGPAAIAARGGAVWVSAEFGQRLVRIDPDPADPRVVGEVAIGNRPKGVVVADEGLWVAVQASGSGHRGGRLIVSSPSLDSIDPTIFGDTAFYAAATLVYDGLTGSRRVGGSEGTQLVPNLAAAIPEARDGGRSYTFRLRPGIRYSDGRRLRPGDFRRALERAYELNGHLAQASVLSNVVGTDACTEGRPCDLSKGIEPEKDSVTFRLSEPDPRFVSTVADLLPIPPQAPRRDTGTKPISGTGPYAIESYVPGRQLKLVRNPHFRVRSEAARPDGYADEIVFRIGAESGKDVTEVAQGGLDVSTVPPERIGEVRARYSHQLHVEPDRATVYLFLDTTQAPFTDVRVRRAVNYAIDRGRIVESGWSGPAAADLPVDRSRCSRLRPLLPVYAQPPPNRRVDGAGPRKGAAADRGVGHERPDGDGVVVAGTLLETFAVIVSLLRRLGYRAHLKELRGFDVAIRTIFDPRTREQSGVVGFFGISDGSVVNSLECGSDENLARFCDRRIDNEAAQALKVSATDPEAAAKIWARLDCQPVHQAPWVPLLNPKPPYFVSERVGNWQYHVYSRVLLDQLWVR